MANRGLNKVQIIGNLGKDPEMKYTPNGKAITTFTVAVNRSVKAPGGDYQEETEWFRVVAWDKLAEFCNQYLARGSKVYVEGRLQSRTWDDKDGQKHTSVEVVANEVLMLDGRSAPASGSRAGVAVPAEDDDMEIPF